GAERARNMNAIEPLDQRLQRIARKRTEDDRNDERLGELRRRADRKHGEHDQGRDRRALASRRRRFRWPGRGVAVVLRAALCLRRRLDAHMQTAPGAGSLDPRRRRFSARETWQAQYFLFSRASSLIFAPPAWTSLPAPSTVLQPESKANDGNAKVAASASAMRRFMMSPFVDG